MNNKWTTWYDSLPKNTQEYLKNQPIWRDRDLAKFCAISFVAGLVLGALL